jgi:hypothetical protein
VLLPEDHHLYSLTKETGGSSETLVPIYQATGLEISQAGITTSIAVRTLDLYEGYHLLRFDNM